MTDLDPVRRASERIKDRLVDGAIQRPEYEELRETILGDLTPEEQAQVEGTPSRVPPPGRPDRIGPSPGDTQGTQRADLDFKPGDVLLGQWRIVRELGRGGFGSVFEAEELHLGALQARP